MQSIALHVRRANSISSARALVSALQALVSPGRLPLAWLTATPYSSNPFRFVARSHYFARMADFRTHVTTSSVLGIGYAGMGVAMGFPIEASIVSGGLCGVSGMLPDLDSDSGIPIRESTGFAAALVPMLLVDRLQALMPYDRMILVTAGLYFLIRFAGASMLGRFTVHRGMFHSIPAVLIFAGLAFVICGSNNGLDVRYLKAGAVFFGAMSHLVLDELYSIEWKGGGWRFKRSFGTALKLWGRNGWANFSTYVKLAVVIVMVTGEPSVMRMLEQRNPGFAERLQQVHDRHDQLVGTVRERLGDGGLAVGGDRLPTTAPAEGELESREAWPPIRNEYRSPDYEPRQPATHGGGFSPNAGSLPPGGARPVYQADGGFSPR